MALGLYKFVHGSIPHHGIVKQTAKQKSFRELEVNLKEAKLGRAI
jgi:hypothetical protein